MTTPFLKKVKNNCKRLTYCYFSHCHSDKRPAVDSNEFTLDVSAC